VYDRCGVGRGITCGGRNSRRDLLGPRLVIASPIVDGPNPIWPGSIAVGNAAEAREAVRTLKQDGADFIKIYSRLPREAFFAIADETTKQGLPFAGHVRCRFRSWKPQRQDSTASSILPASSLRAPHAKKSCTKRARTLGRICLRSETSQPLAHTPADPL